MKMNGIRCETPALPANPREFFITPREEQKTAQRMPNPFHLAKKSPRELLALPLALQQNPQGPLVGKFARCHSPQANGKPQILLPMGAVRLQGNDQKQFRHIPRRLSPQGPHSRPLNIQSKKLPEISLGDLSTDHENNNRSPREFKITTKRALDLLSGSPKSRPHSPQQASSDELFEAAANGDIEKISTLLDPSKTAPRAPANVSAVGPDNKTALHIATQEGKNEVVALLLKYGANPNAKTVHGRTALHIACVLGDYGAGKALLSAGGDYNAQDYELNTPVHYAAGNKHIKLLKLLLEKKPDLTIKNKKGQTAIDITNSKIIISLFWHYLAGSEEAKKPDNPKELPEDSSKPLPNAPPPQKIVIGVSPPKQAPKVKDPLKDIRIKAPELAKAVEAKPKEKRGLLVGPKPIKKVESSRLSARPAADKLSVTEKEQKWNSEDISPTKETETVTLSSFTPVRHLGKGSFGEVFLVQRKSNKKYYAMKVLSKDKIFAQNLLVYAYAERNVQAMINHPFIVRMHCAFQSANKLFLVIDYCPAGDLGTILQREKRFHKDRAKAYLCEILLALQELHNHEIIYRDLKPDNIVMDAEGHVLLTDFGLSKQGIKERDYTKSFCGSIAYLAPEVLCKTGHGRSVDWYLLGTLLYEMLVGVPPYFHRSKDKLFDNIKRGPLQVPQDMPPDALDLIVKLLNRDPRTRLGAGPGDAEEIKAHPFFADVDWDRVMARKLKMPKPLIKPVISDGATFDAFMGGAEKDDNSSRLNKWTFISSDFYS